MSSPAFKYFPKTQSEFKPPLIANENAFLGDVFTTNDSDKPMSAGLYRLEKGTPLVYTYTYHETKIILEGEYDITDETGQTVHVSRNNCPKATCDAGLPCHMQPISISLTRSPLIQAVPGDVFYFPKGSVITFTTNSYGLAFYTGQRAQGAA